jgi:tetratricopeptide (TPR) repeat protein
VRAVEALQDGRFKDAIELFKQLVKQDPTSEWKESLADAYAGRGRALAAKGMFKEAAFVLENTLNAEKILREPALYVACLIRENQAAKAAAYLLHCASSRVLPTYLEELTAALLLSVPQLPPAAGALTPEAVRWRDLAAAARDALGAWVEGAPAEVVESHLARISLRSAFRPLRLLLKTLITRPIDPTRTRTMLDSIAPASPFFPLRIAVEVAIRGGAALDADAWHRLSSAQQGFVAETGGLAPTTTQTVSRLADAARGGSGSLFSWLLKQTNLPASDLRSACLNILPQHPERLAQFERTFGPLSPLEKLRMQALAAEARGKWREVEDAWTELAQLYRSADDRLSRLSAGVIYRHLAQLSREHSVISGGNPREAHIYFLEQSGDVDPDHLPTILTRIAHYRKESLDKEWHRLADEAVAQFPGDSQILLAAMESNVAREAYKKAAGFARRLLSIDPINNGVRRQMIELQVAHARKQMRNKRPDLAAKELALAAEWDRPDAPSALLRIARGLVALRAGQAAAAETWLQEAVALAGGGVAGWFRIVVEAELMKCTAAEIKKLKVALDHARQTPPTRPDVLAVVAALGQPVKGHDKRVLESLLISMHGWLQAGAEIEWTSEEFQTLAETLTRLAGFRLLQEYAAAARKREPGNPEWRFQEIVARTRGNPGMMSFEEEKLLDNMLDAAMERRDFHARARIARFLESGPPRPFRRSRQGVEFGDDFDDALDGIDAEDLQQAIRAILKTMPFEESHRVRALVAERGRDSAVAQIYDDFRGSPLASDMPEPMLRALCEEIVDNVQSTPPRKRGRF